MRVFVTGATGFIAGAATHAGSLEDLESLRRGVDGSDGVIHAGFIHDFTKFKENCEVDRKAIQTLGAALEGSSRPLIITSGTALLAPGRMAAEDDLPMSGPGAIPRVATEEAAASVGSRGVQTSLVRLPPTVHGAGDHGFIPMLIALAREKRVSAYIGEGLNRWPAVHRLDAARLYRLAAEKVPAEIRYHAVAEEGVPFREIAGLIGRHLRVPVVSKSPEEAAGHFGWFASFAALDCPASSARTQKVLEWQPTHASLLADMDEADYFAA